MSDVDIYGQGILLVDDDRNILRLYDEELKRAGFTKIFKALNGLECINILQENGEDVALIVLDIRMPLLDGLETVRNLVNIYDGIVGVIFSTAYSGYRDNAQGLGSDRILNLDYIIKTVNLEPLIESIKKNIRLVLEKREKTSKKAYENILNKLENISLRIETIGQRLEKIEKKTPSFLVDIGKNVIITIILGIFVICALYFGLGDFIRRFLKPQ